MLYTLGAVRFKAGMMQPAMEVAQRILATDPYNDRAQALREQIEHSLSIKAETFNG
jgi:hypothetical protein